jgi:hypothetical protein
MSAKHALTDHRSDTDHSNDDSPFAAAQLLVSCPACRTTFCVESTAVAAMESPRFHCSRCDSLFSLAEAQAHQRRVESIERAGVAERVGGSAPGESAQTVWQQNPGSPVATPLAPSPHSQAMLSAITEPRTRTPFTAPRLRSSSNGIKPSEFSLGSGPNRSRHSTPPAPSRIWESPDTASPLEPIATARVAGEKVTSGRYAFDLGLDEALTKQPNYSPPPPLEVDDEPQETPEPDSTPISYKLDPIMTPSPDTAAPSPYHSNRRSGSTPSGWRSSSPRTRGLLLMSTPLVATFAIMVGLSYSSRMSPETIGATMRAVAPSFLSDATPQLPPSELSVKGLRLQFTKVATQETVALITGTVVNSSDRQIDDVVLEGLGFNAQGEVLVASKAPLRSALSREKPATLPFDSVKRFQSSLSARKPTIGPREEVSFTVALLAPTTATATAGSPAELDLAALKYFSARVFSVRQ